MVSLIFSQPKKELKQLQRNANSVLCQAAFWLCLSNWCETPTNYDSKKWSTRKNSGKTSLCPLSFFLPNPVFFFFFVSVWLQAMARPSSFASPSPYPWPGASGDRWSPPGASRGLGSGRSPASPGGPLSAPPVVAKQRKGRGVALGVIDAENLRTPIWCCFCFCFFSGFAANQSGKKRKACPAMAVLGLCWDYVEVVGLSWPDVGPSWGSCRPILGVCWDNFLWFGVAYGYTGAMLFLLDCHGPMLAHQGAILGLCWALLGPTLALHWAILGLC